MSLAKLARKFGVRPISVFILIIGLIYLFLAYGYFEQSAASTQNATTNASQQHTFQLIQSDLTKTVAAKRELMATLAALPSLQAAVASGDSVLIEEWQTSLASSLIEGTQLCVMTTIPSSVDATACVPLNFATLATLRDLKNAPMSNMAIMQPKSPDAQILLAHKITGVPEFPQASLVMTWPKAWLKQQLPPVGQHYVELTQGQEGGAVLAGKGDATSKQSSKVQTKAIAGSLWSVNYWSQAQTSKVSLWLFAAIAGLIVLITWWMTRAWLSHVFEVDSKVIKEQLGDLENNKLKPSYPVMSRTLKSVSALINELVLPHKVAADVKAMEIPAIEVGEESESPIVETHSELPPVPEVEELPAVEEELPIAPEAESIVEEAIANASESAIEPIEPIEPKESEETKPLSEVDLAFDAPPEPATDNVLEFDSPSIEKTPPPPPKPKPAAPVSSPQLAVEPGMPDPAIFRKYDIRGKVGLQLNAQIMELLGKAVASEAIEQGFKKLVMGRDGRLSSDKFAEAFSRGALMAGCDVIDLNVVPTPLMYFACEQLETQTGVMITGSHNPADCNGLKVVIGGRSLLGEEVQALYHRIKEERFTSGHGQLSTEIMTRAYLERIRGDVKAQRPLKLVVDCGNGAAGFIAPDVFRVMGCEVIELHCNVDGHFPNHHPDPGQPENMQDLIEAVKQHDADIGFAFDGDGDRLGVVDGEGNIIWPDQLLILMAQELLAKEPGATIVYDVKCTSLLEKIITRSGGKPVMTGSGHSVIKDAMHRYEAMLGGEMTGHFFYADRWYGFDDALYSGARLLELLAADPLERTPTDILAALPKRVSTPEIIVDMAEGESRPFVEQLMQQANFEDGKVTTIDGLRVDFKQGWGLVRASNTVPGLTLRFEGVDEDALDMIKQQFIAQMLQVKPSLTLMI